MSTVENLQRELAGLESALDALTERIECLQTSEPVSAEGRDASRDALKAARMRLEILRSQAARGACSARALQEAERAAWALEMSLAPDETVRAELENLFTVREALESEYNAKHAELGRAQYAVLTADVRSLEERAEEAENAAKTARHAVSEARAGVPARLQEWPDLAAQARAKYATERADKPDAVVSLFDAYLAFLDAIEDARGAVPMVIEGINTGLLLEMNVELERSIIHKGSGTIDQRQRDRIRQVRDAARVRS